MNLKKIITRIVAKSFAYGIVSLYLPSLHVMKHDTLREQLSVKNRTLLDFSNDVIHTYSDLSEIILYRAIRNEMVFDSDNIYSSDAVMFARSGSPDKYYGNHILVINCPQGSSKIMIDEEGVVTEDEIQRQEYYIPSGSRLKLTKIEERIEDTLYYCDLLPNRPTIIRDIKGKDTFEMINYLRNASDDIDFKSIYESSDPDYESLMKPTYIIWNNEEIKISTEEPEMTQRFVIIEPFEFFSSEAIARRAQYNLD